MPPMPALIASLQLEGAISPRDPGCDAAAAGSGGHGCWTGGGPPWGTGQPPWGTGQPPWGTGRPPWEQGSTQTQTQTVQVTVTHRPDVTSTSVQTHASASASSSRAKGSSGSSADPTSTPLLSGATAVFTLVQSGRTLTITSIATPSTSSGSGAAAFSSPTSSEVSSGGSNLNTSSASSRSSHAGIIAGGILGALLALSLLALTFCLYHRQRRQHQRRHRVAPAPPMTQADLSSATLSHSDPFSDPEAAHTDTSWSSPPASRAPPLLATAAAAGTAPASSDAAADKRALADRERTAERSTPSPGARLAVQNAASAPTSPGPDSTFSAAAAPRAEQLSTEELVRALNQRLHGGGTVPLSTSALASPADGGGGEDGAEGPPEYVDDRRFAQMRRSRVRAGA